MEAPHELSPDLNDAELFVLTILEQEVDFVQSQVFREQCARAYCACRLNRDRPIPLGLIASVLGVTHGTFVSHSRNQLQPLDVCIFGMTKKLIQFTETESRQIQNRHIAQILEGLGHRAPLMTIVSALRNAGINGILEKMVGPTVDMMCNPLCLVTPETCRCPLRDDFGIEELVMAARDEEEDSEFDFGVEEEQGTITLGEWKRWATENDIPME
jgi:hypothetical protein